MATGALDVNGIWQYGADDPRAPFQTTLNMGQSSTSAAVGSLKARATALENANILGAVGSPCTAGPGWTLTVNQGRKKNGMAFVRISVTRAAAAVAVGSDGNVADMALATFAAGWAAASGVLYPAASLNLADFAFVQPDGIYLTAVAPGLTIPTGRVMQFAAVYPLN